MRAKLGLDIRTPKEVECFAGASEIILEQLRLSERKQVRQVLGFKLNRSPEMFLRRGGILFLKQFEDAEQVMGPGKIGHERKRLFKLGTNFCRGWTFHRQIVSRRVGGEAQLLRRVNVVSQETDRTALQSLTQEADRLVRLFALGR